MLQVHVIHSRAHHAFLTTTLSIGGRCALTGEVRALDQHIVPTAIAFSANSRRRDETNQPPQLSLPITHRREQGPRGGVLVGLGPINPRFLAGEARNDPITSRRPTYASSVRRTKARCLLPVCHSENILIRSHTYTYTYIHTHTQTHIHTHTHIHRPPPTQHRPHTTDHTPPTNQP